MLIPVLKLLYKAFTELGKVIGTIFVFKYISDSTLRSTIQAANCKSESFNVIIKWIRFGGDETLKENDRDEQRTLIKYNHLVAHFIIFHNVCILTHLLNELEKEGLVFYEENIAAISPYIREHINPFGAYILNLQRKQPWHHMEWPSNARSSLWRANRKSFRKMAQLSQKKERYQ